MSGLTEDEAREKWCPFVRLHADDPTSSDTMYSYNRPGAMGGMTCIGSKCMAWLWVKDQRGPGPVRETREDGPPEPVPGHRWYKGTDSWGLFPRVGFCGLASSPTPKE